ncbi:hypothetical protein GGF43_001603 [Coemansia sp. RSA 2618]|nr:hypothetical protein GGF43_001603 [Coemansia sp. RSA 2618]
MVWLDIEQPTHGDVQAITQVFKISHLIARHMRRAHELQHSGHPVASTCQSSKDQLYVCWTEPPQAEHTNMHLHQGASKDAQLPWAPSWLNSKYGQAGKHSDERRREHRLEHLKRLLDTSRAHTLGTRRQRWIVRRWGYERWRDFLHADHRARMIRRTSLEPPPRPIPQSSPPHLQTSVVQIWTRGPVTVTLRTRSSWAITQVANDITAKMCEPTSSSDTILQAIVEKWLRNDHASLRALYACSNALAEKTMQAIGSDPMEATQWASNAQHSHKLSLHLLQHARTNTLTLRGLFTARPLYAYKIMLAEQSRTTRAFAHVERQLGQLSGVLFARLRQRLLLTGNLILDAMNVCLVVHFVFAPVQLWTNLDNLNHITTPGVLLKDDMRMFYWQFLVFAVWTLGVYIAYRVYYCSRHVAVSSTKTEKILMMF